ncbi:hypothetical protein JNJ66_05660 [Candidatus Saccharibacteria bacterium]|nr:hypothetical protein [Candidatus Saccharibacteria bacterium]
MTNPNTLNTDPSQAAANTAEAKYDPKYFDFLRPDSVDTLRVEQHSRVHEAVKDIDAMDFKAVRDARNNAYAEFDGHLDEYLTNNGIADDDPSRDGYKAVLREFSVDRMSDATWNLPQEHVRPGQDPNAAILDMETITGRELLNREVNRFEADVVDDTMLDRAIADNETHDRNARTEAANALRESDEFKNAHIDYEIARDKLAALGAKHASSLRTRMSRSKRQEMATARYEYEAAMIALGHRELEIFRTENPITDDDPARQAELTAESDRQFALAYALRSERDLQIDTNEQIKDTRLNRILGSAVVQYMINGQLFSSKEHDGWHGAVVKGAKGVIFGGAIGATTAVFAGLGLVTAAAAATGFALRAGRGFAIRDAREGNTLAVVEDGGAFDKRLQENHEATTANADFDTVLSEAAFVGREHYDTSLYDERSKRRKSAIKSVGVAALGFGIGYSLTTAADAWNDIPVRPPEEAPRVIPAPGDSAPLGDEAVPSRGPDTEFNLPGGLGHDSTPGEVSGNNYSNMDSLPNPENQPGGTTPDQLEDYIDSGHDAAPEISSAVDSTEIDADTGVDTDVDTGADGGTGGEGTGTDGGDRLRMPELSSYTVDRGMGFYELMGDIGIDHSQYAQVLQDAGPELRDQGYAYWDESRGNWGLRYPEGGKLPKEALQILYKHATKS